MTPPVARAITGAREALIAAPDSADAWGGYGAVLDAHDFHAEATSCYERARALAPQDFRWAYMLAIMRDFQGAGAEELVPAFQDAIRLEPDYPPAQVRFGDALVRVGRLPEARAAYEKALELDPEFAIAHRNLGQVLVSLEEPATAIEHLERARALTPDDGMVHSTLARAYWLAGDAERAKAAEEEANLHEPVYGIPDPVRRVVDDLALNPLDVAQRAAEHMESGEFEAAIQDLAVLAESSPDDASIEARLGTCYLRTGDLEQARAHLDRALTLNDGLVEPHLQLAALDEARGDLAAAAQHYRRTVEQLPSNRELRKKLGRCLGQMGDLEGAVEQFEQAHMLGVPDAELLHNWGTALDRLGRHEDALRHFEAALELVPENAGVHFNLALTLEQLGRVDEAIEHYERTLALDPSLPAAQRLAALRTSQGTTTDGERSESEH
jgi:superkiller protein 3